ncbi:MAG: hypothetical protein QN163_06870 [Armatimonadota bacterium]|nr:hypothetical protein [Armatimonadota bacterium]MDR5696424.1 hypothetical protein [Armatimonadota bacterium]
MLKFLVATAVLFGWCMCLTWTSLRALRVPEEEHAIAGVFMGAAFALLGIVLVQPLF